MPQFSGPDPRLFNFGGAVAEGLRSGVGTGAQLADIQFKRDQLAQEAELRPLKRKLADIQLKTAEQNLAMPHTVWDSETLVDTTGPDEPVAQDAQWTAVTDSEGNPVAEEDGAVVQVGEDGLLEKVGPSGVVFARQAVDEKGQPMFEPGPTKYAKAPLGDIITEKTGREFSGGTVKPVTSRGVTKLGQQRQLEDLSKVSLVDSRRAAAELAQARLDTQREIEANKIAQKKAELAVKAEHYKKLDDNPQLASYVDEVDGRAIKKWYQKGHPENVVFQDDIGIWDRSWSMPPAAPAVVAPPGAAVRAAAPAPAPTPVVPVATPTTFTVPGAPAAAVTTQPTPRAIRALILNPTLAAEFNKKYGQGAAEAYLQ